MPRAFHPDADSMLGGGAGLATGDSSPMQRKAMNALLRKIDLQVVLDDSRKEAPMVVITVNNSVPMTQPFMSEFEIVVLRDLFPPARPPSGGWIEQEGGGFLAFGD